MSAVSGPRGSFCSWHLHASRRLLSSELQPSCCARNHPLAARRLRGFPHGGKQVPEPILNVFDPLCEFRKPCRQFIKPQRFERLVVYNDVSALAHHSAEQRPCLTDGTEGVSQRSNNWFLINAEILGLLVACIYTFGPAAGASIRRLPGTSLKVSDSRPS